MNLELSSDHIVPIGLQGAPNTVTVLSGSTLNWSSASNRVAEGTVVVGASQVFQEAVWVWSQGLSEVSVTSNFPPAISLSQLPASVVAVGSIPSSVAGGRAVVATRWSAVSSGTGAISLGVGANSCARVEHVLQTACSDLRLVYGVPLNIENSNVGGNEIWVKAGIEDPVAEVAQLSATIQVSDGNRTTLPVTSPVSLASAAVVTVGTQTWTLSGPYTAGGATMAVNSQTPNATYQAGTAVTSPIVYPVTFGGQQYGVIDNYGHIISDPCAAEFPAGKTVYIRTYQRVPFTSGAGYLTLAAGFSAGVNQVTTTTPPTGTLPQTVQLDQNANAETVTVLSYTGTSNPYTLNLAANITKNHSISAVIGQGGFSNMEIYGDIGEASASSDLSWSGVFTANQGLSEATGTLLSPGITAGASSFQMAAPLSGATLTVDTGGTPETVTVANWQGTANPFTCYIVGTFANNHTTGATVQSGVFAATGLGPLAVVADRVNGTRKKAVIIVGDSIPNGTGYSARVATSYMSLTLDNAGYPYVQLTKSGEAAYQFVCDAASQLRRRLITLGDWADYEYGTNDLFGGQSLAEAQTNTLAILSALKQRGLKVCVHTLTPRTTSTDSFATATNQTKGTTSETARVAYNNWLRAWLSNGLKGAYVDALFDMANVLEVNSSNVLTQDGGYWLATGSASTSYTADGLHPSFLGHQYMATAITPGTIFV